MTACVLELFSAAVDGKNGTPGGTIKTPLVLAFSPEIFKFSPLPPPNIIHQVSSVFLLSKRRIFVMDISSPK
ncbi:uncharacterized protein BDV17DRAFT_153307 [Aspergillus undulatus]|uniref:uncharacterized protein n=1 Tax=Aspergillus undulatus TaxID=1810928 RepID=UPI003CCD133E